MALDTSRYSPLDDPGATNPSYAFDTASQPIPTNYSPTLAPESAGFAGSVVPAPPPITEEEPEAAARPVVGFDAQSNQLYVNGSVFDAADHQSAVESQEYLSQPDTEMPANFQPLSAPDYNSYLDGILNPTMGRLAKKNFGIGVDQSQQLAGSALKFFGAEETGQSIIDQQTEDMRFNQPYQRSFTEDALGGDPGEWFVANAAQVAPLVLEMIITSLATGGVAGMAAAGGAGAKMLAKGAIKKAAKGSIPKTEAMAAIRGARMARQGNLVKGSTEALALRSAGRAFGAKAGAISASEGVAIGDIYQSVEESGNFDSPTLARLITLLASVPYAAAEVLPAFAAVNTAMGKGGSKFLRRGGRMNRAIKGVGAGMAVEGPTEVFQDMLALGASNKLDLHNPEVQNQLINAFAAGAGFGGPIGGLVNVIPRTIEDANKREPMDTTEPEADMLNRPKLDEGQEQGELFTEDERGANVYREVPTRVESDQAYDAALAERDSLLEERDRLMRAQGGIYAEAADLMNQDISLRDATVDEVIQIMSKQEGRFGELDTNLEQIDPALVEIDRQLELYGRGLPPRGLPQAERLGSQPTIFGEGIPLFSSPYDLRSRSDHSSVASTGGGVMPQYNSNIQGVERPVALGMGGLPQYESNIQGVDPSANLAQTEVNRQYADDVIGAIDEEVALQEEQERTPYNLTQNILQEGAMQQAERARDAQPQQLSLNVEEPMGNVDAFAGAPAGFQGNPLQAQEEFIDPTVEVDVLIMNKAGKSTGKYNKETVSASEAIAETTGGMDALNQLAACLRGGGTTRRMRTPIVT